MVVEMRCGTAKKKRHFCFALWNAMVLVVSGGISRVMDQTGRTGLKIWRLRANRDRVVGDVMYVLTKFYVERASQLELERVTHAMPLKSPTDLKALSVFKSMLKLESSQVRSWF
jgi:hypothetical protein